MLQRSLASATKGNMKLRVIAIEEVNRAFPKRNGTEGREAGLSVRDVSIDGPRCTNNLTYVWAKGEEDKYKGGKLRDRFLVLGISKLVPGFGGQISAEGSILEIEGPDPGNGAPVSVSVKGGAK